MVGPPTSPTPPHPQPPQPPNPHFPPRASTRRLTCYLPPNSPTTPTPPTPPRDAMIELQVACDGGKDSLSMAAAAGGETVMAPGNLVVSAYVGCPDITKVGGRAHRTPEV